MHVTGAVTAETTAIPAHGTINSMSLHRHQLLRLVITPWTFLGLGGWILSWIWLQYPSWGLGGCWLKPKKFQSWYINFALQFHNPIG